MANFIQNAKDLLKQIQSGANSFMNQYSSPASFVAKQISPKVQQFAQQNIAPKVQQIQQSTQPIANYINSVNLPKQTYNPVGINLPQPNLQNITQQFKSIFNNAPQRFNTMVNNIPQPIKTGLQAGIPALNPTVQNIGKGLIENFVFNPQTKQLFPQSPIYSTPDKNELSKLTQKYVSKTITKDEYEKFIKLSTKVGINEAMMFSLNSPIKAAGQSAMGAIANPEAKQALRNLLTYGSDLQKIGYGAKEIDKISAVQGRNILEQQMPNFWKESKGIPLDTTRKAILEGETRGYLMGKNVKDAFANWINTRRASQVEGLIKSKEFTNLDEKGVNGFMEFQAGLNKEKFAPLRKYFDTKFLELKNAGVDIGYRKDYLNQLWQNTPQEVQQVLGRKLGLHPSFTMDNVFKSYEEGIANGLVPKFGKISDLVQWYESHSNKSIADVTYFGKLAEDKLILPAGKAPSDWVTLSPDRFPKVQAVLAEGKSYVGNYKAPSDLAGLINNYLNDAQFKTLEKVADFASAAKNRALSFGVPQTAINSHGFNILARNVLSGNPIEGAVTGIKYMLNSNSASAYLDKNLAKAPFAIRHGLKLSTNEFNSVLEVDKSIVSKFGKMWNNAFEKPLFEKMLPALKLQKFYEVFEGFKKSGMSEYQAGREAAKFANDVFGGINWEEMGRSKDFQNVLRTVILAPDWANTTINLGKKMVTSLLNPTNPAGQAYRKFAATFVGSYVTMNVTNKITSGHFMFQNEPGHTFEIDSGGYTDTGQKRYIRVYGTAADFARLPSDIAVGLAKGDPTPAFRAVRNRLSVFAAPAVGLFTNTDPWGNPIYGSTKYGQEMTPAQNITGVGNELASMFGTPSFLRNAADYITGKQSLEAAATQGFELPFRYAGGTYNTAQKQLQGMQPLTGEELWKRNQLAKGQTKLGANQATLVEKNPAALESIYLMRDPEAMYNKLKAMQPQQAAAIATQLKKDNPSAYKELQTYMADKSLKTTKEEQDIRKLTIGDLSRAKAITKVVNALKTPEEKASAINRYIQLGIISDEVLKQLNAAKKIGVLK